MYMQQFLMYGRQLTLDEMDVLALGETLGLEFSSPNMELFKEQVPVYINITPSQTEY